MRACGPCLLKLSEWAGDVKARRRIIRATYASFPSCGILPGVLLECFRKSGNRFSDKKHDKTKAWSRSAIPSKTERL